MQTRPAFCHQKSIRRRQGIAIITVMLLSGVILAFVLGGLNVAAQHLFQVSALHNRHRALCAAEVGVSKAQYQLEQNPAATATVTGSLDDGSRYQVTIQRVGTRAVLHSVGQVAGQSQRLKVTLALDADTFLGVSSRGMINIRKNGYVNGIRSLGDVRSARGNIYTEGDIEIEPDARLSVTGQASAGGDIDTRDRVDGQVGTGGNPANLSFTKADLLPASYDIETLTDPSVIPASGEVSQNTRLDIPGPDPVVYTQPLHIPAGVTLYVTGDLVLHGGASGEGNLVVDGTLLMRGSEELRVDNPKGLLIYGGKDVLVAHPSAHVDSSDSDGFTAQVSPVGELFARMPEGVPYLLRQRLPPGAPANVNFFDWYGRQERSPSAAFQEWKNGDGTTLNPGLPTEVTRWLHDAAAIHDQIEDSARR